MNDQVIEWIENALEATEKRAADPTDDGDRQYALGRRGAFIDVLGWVDAQSRSVRSEG